MTRIRSAKRVSSFADSVFGEMTRLAKLHNAVNLSQGFPDFEAPQAIKDAACAAIQAEQNQYAPPYGTQAFRDTIASDFTRRYGVRVIADEQVTVCCGSTEAMMASMLACIDPGDEVIVFEPFYENYGPDAILAGAEPKYVRLREPDWRFDPDELTARLQQSHARDRHQFAEQPDRQGVHARGAAADRRPLPAAGMCSRSPTRSTNASSIDGHAHVPMASIPGMADRTITTSGLSKTYSVTGWRIGWAISPASLTGGIRKIHDFLTVAAPTPFHDAGVAAMSMPDDFYTGLAADYQAKRDLMVDILGRHGFTCYQPGGAYYVMADVSRFGFSSDSEFAQYLSRRSAWRRCPAAASISIPPRRRRPCASVSRSATETLHEADRRLARLSVRLGADATARQAISGDRA